jgi:hypothetical protein
VFYCNLFFLFFIVSFLHLLSVHYLGHPSLLGEIGLLLQPCSRPLLGARSSSGRLDCHLILAFVTFLMVIPWEFGTECLGPCHNPILWGRFSIPLPPMLLVLDYSSLYMLFSFVGGKGSVCPRAALDCVPRGWVGQLPVVDDAHLFVLQVHTSSFGISWQGEIMQQQETFHGLGVQDVIEVNSVWSSVFLLVRRKKKLRKK